MTFKHYLERLNKYHNCFLTEKECHRHIETNKHHYTNRKNLFL